MQQITILPLPSGPVSTNAYLVICNETKEAAVFDPSPGSAQKIIDAVQKHHAKVVKIILTHSHWDHIADTFQLVEEWHPAVLIHKEDAGNLMQPGSDGLTCWISIQGVKPTGYLIENDSVMIGKSAWKVIHTPGHSPGGICLFCEKEKVLISGDTLFKGTCGRLDLPTGEPERMWPSLKKLTHLPYDTTVFPGHGPSTQIGKESWLDKAQELFN